MERAERGASAAQASPNAYRSLRAVGYHTLTTGKGDLEKKTYKGNSGHPRTLPAPNTGANALGFSGASRTFEVVRTREVPSSLQLAVGVTIELTETYRRVGVVRSAPSAVRRTSLPRGDLCRSDRAALNRVRARVREQLVVDEERANREMSAPWFPTTARV